MQHKKVTFEIADQPKGEMLIAMLSDLGYNGFEELEHTLLAYIEETQFNAADLVDIATLLGVEYRIEVVAAQNWNALWESNFQPVIVDDFCTLRAHFHEIEVTTPYEIVITPKMSFGTGHHATTQLVMLMMKDIDFKVKTVLDFGTGTGVLAILAELLGATDILAIDNDEWSVENAIENAARNNCHSITVEQACIDEILPGTNDIIVANINRHILLQYMNDLYARLAEDGMIIMSGLLTDDREIMLKAAADAGFRFEQLRERNNWISILFTKG